MAQCILTVNAGSSSVKFALYTATATPDLIASGQVEGIGTTPRFKLKTATDKVEVEVQCANQNEAFTVILTQLNPLLDGAEVSGVGHRVVHGGFKRVAPVELTDDIVVELETLVPLALLHQPHNLAGVQAARKAFPHAKQIGCFDTAFHRDHAWEEDTYAIPRRFYDAGVRRYGFHGLSYDYVSSAVADMYPALADKKLIICHLGSGASICAVEAGKSVSSTMGFSPLDGLPMATRSGQVDPGVLLYLMDHDGMSAQDVTQMLYYESGLLGLSELSNDIKTLEASGAPKTVQALSYYVTRIQREIGGMAAVMGGVDALVFCGGVGENSATIREGIAAKLGFLGIALDKNANEKHQSMIHAGTTPVMVVPTDEERVIANAVVSSLDGSV